MKMDELLLAAAGKSEITAIQKEMREKDNGPKYDEDSHAGCTANVVLITPDYIYCANAGDSRAVASIDGKTVELSKDHKPEDPIELNRITRAGGTVSYGRVNGGLNLSRALGDL
jgi:serine/threonine protein phosphatase PrpC